MGRPKNIPEDVWKYIDKKGEEDCWEWSGLLVRGYGQIRINYKKYRPHRLIYEEINGIIPEGMLVCHHCDNRKCCNPSHLFLGTSQDNVNDMVLKGKHGVGEKNGNSKLTEKDILNIRGFYSTGEYLYEDLGEMFKISSKHISRIIRRKAWRHL